MTARAQQQDVTLVAMSSSCDLSAALSDDNAEAAAPTQAAIEQLLQQLQETFDVSPSPGSSRRSVRRKHSSSDLQARLFVDASTTPEPLSYSQTRAESAAEPGSSSVDFSPRALLPRRSNHLPHFSDVPSLSADTLTPPPTPGQDVLLSECIYHSPTFNSSAVDLSVPISTKRKFDNIQFARRLPVHARADSDSIWQVHAAIVDLNDQFGSSLNIVRPHSVGSPTKSDGLPAVVGSQRALGKHNIPRGVIQQQSVPEKLPENTPLVTYDTKHFGPLPTQSARKPLLRSASDTTPVTAQSRSRTISQQSSPTTFHYKGASFDLINPHASLSLTQSAFETPAEIDNLLEDYFAEHVEEMTGELETSESSSKRGRRLLYDDAVSARHNIMGLRQRRSPSPNSHSEKTRRTPTIEEREAGQHSRPQQGSSTNLLSPRMRRESAFSDPFDLDRTSENDLQRAAQRSDDTGIGMNGRRAESANSETNSTYSNLFDKYEYTRNSTDGPQLYDSPSMSIEIGRGYVDETPPDPPLRFSDGDIPRFPFELRLDHIHDLPSSQQTYGDTGLLLQITPQQNRINRESSHCLSYIPDYYSPRSSVISSLSFAEAGVKPCPSKVRSQQWSAHQQYSESINVKRSRSEPPMVRISTIKSCDESGWESDVDNSKMWQTDPATDIDCQSEDSYANTSSYSEDFGHPSERLMHLGDLDARTSNKGQRVLGIELADNDVGPRFDFTHESLSSQVQNTKRQHFNTVNAIEQAHSGKAANVGQKPPNRFLRKVFAVKDDSTAGSDSTGSPLELPDDVEYVSAKNNARVGDQASLHADSSLSGLHAEEVTIRPGDIPTPRSIFKVKRIVKHFSDHSRSERRGLLNMTPPPSPHSIDMGNNEAIGALGICNRQNARMMLSADPWSPLTSMRAPEPIYHTRSLIQSSPVTPTPALCEDIPLRGILPSRNVWPSQRNQFVATLSRSDARKQGSDVEEDRARQGALSDDELVAAASNWRDFPILDHARAAKRILKKSDDAHHSTKAIEEARLLVANGDQIREQRKLSTCYFWRCAWFPPLALAFGLGWVDRVLARRTGGRITSVTTRDKRYALVCALPLALVAWTVIVLVLVIVVNVVQRR